MGSCSALWLDVGSTEFDDLGDLLDLAASVGRGYSGDLERIADVVGNAHMRVEGVVLEHHRTAARSGLVRMLWFPLLAPTSSADSA